MAAECNVVRHRRTTLPHFVLPMLVPSLIAKRCIVFRHRHNRLFFGWQKREIPPAQAEMFAVGVGGKIGKIKLRRRCHNIFAVGKSGGKVKQKTGTGKQRIICLPFGIFRLSAVCFVQQHIPFTVVFKVAPIYPLLFALVRDICGTVRYLL